MKPFQIVYSLPIPGVPVDSPCPRTEVDDARTTHGVSDESKRGGTGAKEGVVQRNGLALFSAYKKAELNLLNDCRREDGFLDDDVFASRRGELPAFEGIEQHMARDDLMDLIALDDLDDC